jgi:hypothetical protein
MRCTQKGNDRRLERHPRTVKPGRSPIPLGTTGHSGLGAGDYSSPAPMLLNGAGKVNAGKVNAGSSALNPIFVTGPLPLDGNCGFARAATGLVAGQH